MRTALTRSRAPGAAAAAATIFVALAIVVPSVGSAADTATWKAPVGARGANGTATLTAPATTGGAGTLKLALKGLTASTAYPVKVHAGTCAKPGSVLYAAPTQRSTAAGKIVKSLAVPAAKMDAIRAAASAVIRVGSGARLRCGAFSGGPPAPSPTPTPMPTLGPAEVTAKITVGAFPTSVANDGQMVYVGNSHDWSISRVDPKSNSVLSVYQLSLSGTSGIADLLYAETSIWAAAPSVSDSDQPLAGSVVRVDPASGQTLATIAVGKTPWDLGASPGAVWVANYSDGTVSRIDAATNKVVATVTIGGRPVGIAYAFDSIWVGDEKAGTISRIDPATNGIIATIPTVGSPEGVAAAAGFIWVANYGAEVLALGMVSKIDPATNQVAATYPVVGNPLGISSGGGSLWMHMNDAHDVVRLDPNAPGETPQRIDVGDEPRDIDATDHAAWVAVPVLPTSQGAAAPPGKLVRIDY